ncbi:hypothetical protein PSCT_04527 [Pseudomonas sp. SCT]|uniref:hypothetical protein n=1 Tax=Pseudomonas sp. (strain SCT) TaxID=412955 RepID=UPI000ED68D91|nr:hypothetical protein [Pseudomonas sp. SCT]GCA58307.1 hypothetical protein PSCT_04527 [Pseudomonas sp. SCT]
MGDDVTHFLKSGAKLLPMRPLYHPFVFRAKMSSGELFKEYNVFQAEDALFLLYYFSNDGHLKLRVCSKCSIINGSDGVGFFALDEEAGRYWPYLGFKVYSLKRVPLVDGKGAKLPENIKRKRIKYYTDMISWMKITTKDNCHEKTAIALSGKRVSKIKKNLPFRESLSKIFS